MVHTRAWQLSFAEPATKAVPLLAGLARLPVQDAGIKTADAVLLGAHEELGPLEADAMTLASLLQLQDAVLSSGRTTAPHVVAKVQRYGTQQVRRRAAARPRHVRPGHCAPATLLCASGHA